MYVCSPLPKTLQSTKKCLPPIPFLLQANIVINKKVEALKWFPVGNMVSLVCPVNSLNKTSTPVQKSLLEQLKRNRNVCSQETFTFYPHPHSPAASSVAALLHIEPLLWAEGTMPHHQSSKDAFIPLSAILVLEFAYCSKHMTYSHTLSLAV